MTFELVPTAALTKKSLTPGLLRLIEEATETKYALDFSAVFYIIRRRWKPPALADGTVAEIKIVLTEIEMRLSPARTGDMSTSALATLMQFYVPDVPKRVEVRMADDWIADLSEFPIWAIDAAFRDWRRSKNRRPVIAEIRSACDIAVREMRHWQRVFERCLDEQSAIPA